MNEYINNILDITKRVGTSLVPGANAYNAYNALDETYGPASREGLSEHGLQENTLDFIPAAKLGSMFGKASNTVKTVTKAPTRLEGFIPGPGANKVYPSKLLDNGKDTARYAASSKAVDGDPATSIMPIHQSVFDKKANNLGERQNSLIDAKTRHDNLMANKPILDDDGFPAEFAHGTNTTFKKFATSKQPKELRINPDNEYGDWSWHTPDKKYSDTYSGNTLGQEVINAQAQTNYLMPKKLFDPNNLNDIKSLQKHIKNNGKYDKDIFNNVVSMLKNKDSGFHTAESQMMKKFYEMNGYDAAVSYVGGKRNIMMKSPNRIKNKNNRGTFDVTNSDTMKALIPGATLGSMYESKDNEK